MNPICLGVKDVLTSLFLQENFLLINSPVSGLIMQNGKNAVGFQGSEPLCRSKVSLEGLLHPLYHIFKRTLKRASGLHFDGGQGCGIPQ